MPHVSKIKLDKKEEEELIKNFDFVLSSLSNENEMERFTQSLLSKTERIMLAKRLGVAILLKEEVPQTSIASGLNVTQATVSRMQLYLEVNGEGYELALRKLKEKKAFQHFKNFLLQLAEYSIRAAGGYVRP